MDYSRWVSSRRRIWDEFDARIGAGRAAPSEMSFEDLEELALGYRRILHDSAVARTRYPASAAARRLENLSLQGAFILQGETRPERFTLRHFYGRVFPASCRRILPRLQLALVIFLLSAVFSGVAALASPGLGLRMLGEKRVDDLRQGRLWTESLTTGLPPGMAASGIARNNMTVAIIAWAGGSLAGFGPLYALILNGALLGGLFGVTWHFGMAGALGAFVSAHGPLEIFLILMSAAAGLELARGLIVAGDRSRGRTLKEAGTISLNVLLGSLPWFLLLGVVEAFVSPNPQLPLFLKMGTGALLLASYLAVAFRKEQLSDAA